MKIVISTPHIIGKKTLSIKKYIIFSMFFAPLIDLLNGYYGEIFPIGQVMRILLILVNSYLCTRRIPLKEKKTTYAFFFIEGYILIQSVITGMIFTSSNAMVGLNFGMKLILFLSETQMLINYSKNGTIRKDSFENFWKFSCWFVPLSLLLCKAINVSNVANDSLAGLYSSVNAMSIIFVIQFVLSLYFSRGEKKYLIVTLLNIIAVVLLGTKSPYLYVGAVVIALILFYSKHRIRTVITIIVTAIVAYCFVSKYFASDMLGYIDYHTYFIEKALKTNTIWEYLSSGRSNMLLNEWNTISGKGLTALKLLFGVGRTNFAIAVEMDLFEIIFAYGIFVAIEVYYFVIRSFSWKCMDMTENLFLNIALICMISYSILGGHTFTEAISATYSAILIGYKYSCYLDEGGKNAN